MPEQDLPVEPEIIEIEEDEDGNLAVVNGNTQPNTRGYYDQTEFLKNEKGQNIQFYHLPSKRGVAFKAFITNFSDSYESSWNTEEVYGRMDPIATFQGTRRTINLGWQVVASSPAEAQENLAKCQSLFKMLYPVYESQGVLQAPPLFRLKVMNWVQDASNPNTRTAKDGGLVGFPSGFAFNPDLEVGAFDSDVGRVYPKVINLECSYTVLHTHEVGFYKENGEFIEGRFPYGMGSKTKNPRPRRTKGGNPSETQQDNLATGETYTEAEVREKVQRGAEILNDAAARAAAALSPFSGLIGK